MNVINCSSLFCFVLCGPQSYSYSKTGSEPFLMEYRLRALIRRFFTLVSTKGDQGRWGGQRGGGRGAKQKGIPVPLWSLAFQAQ